MFAAQNPKDRSVRAVSTTEEYWRFYEKACKYYGKSLLVKLHPWNNNEVELAMRAISGKYECQCHKCGHGCLSKCDHVVLFNSSFAVDCMLRGVRVKQGYPGYFYKTDAVTYCSGDITLPLNDTRDAGYTVANFLAWRYCFSMDISLDVWKDILRAFAHSQETFPLKEHLSYAHYLSTSEAPSDNCS